MLELNWLPITELSFCNSDKALPANIMPPFKVATNK